MAIDEELVRRFVSIVGEAHATVDPDPDALYLRELRRLYRGRAAIVLRPRSTDEVSAILRLANESGTPIVPQGGNTGLVGGQIPDESGAAILLQLGRMDRIRRVDPAGMTLIAEAGAILHDVRERADADGLMFPLSLASQGSAQIGGLLSTNAGGVNVLAYGNMRDLVLGIEVVLADGRVLPDLRALKKDNTGYDLKNLFIGAEGTLGIITAAVLKLVPRPAGRQVGFAAVSSPAAALSLLKTASARAVSTLTAFELIQRSGLDLVLKHQDGLRDPFAERHDWYVLFEISSGRSEEDAASIAEAILTEALEEETVRDAVISRSIRQLEELWRLRENLSDAQRAEGPSIKHDISVPVAALPAFIEEGAEAIARTVPEGRLVCFGHMGDGNLHFNVQGPAGSGDAFLDQWRTLNAAVHEVVRAHQGSFAAEHGVGRLKRDELVETSPPVAIELMRTIRKALDPNAILNPGKLF